MPVHDWTRISAGIFHDFHCAWIIHLRDALNRGILPKGYYALAEQHASQAIADVLTLETQPQEAIDTGGGAAVAVAPPTVSRKSVASPKAALRLARRTLTIRHVSNHRIVALVEILSPANKDRSSSIHGFVSKVHDALAAGCHVMVIDLLPRGPGDPRGIHFAIWETFNPDEETSPAETTVSLASYVATPLPEAYLEFLAIGAALPDMPLFLAPDRHVKTPLEKTYMEAYSGFPEYWREVLEG